MLPRLFLTLAWAAASADASLSPPVPRRELHRAMRELDLSLLRLDRELERSLRAAMVQQKTLVRAFDLLGVPGLVPTPGAVGDTLPRLLPAARAAALAPLGRAIWGDGWSIVAELLAWPRAYLALGLGLPDPAGAELTAPFWPTAELVATLHHEAQAVDRLWRDVAWVHGLLQGLERDVSRLAARVEAGDRAPARLELLHATACALAELLATPLLTADELRLSVAAHRLLRTWRGPG